MINLLFHRSDSHETINGDIPLLSDSPRPFPRLYIRTRVPVRVVDNHTIRSDQIQSQTSDTGCEDEHKDRRVLCYDGDEISMFNPIRIGEPNQAYGFPNSEKF